MRNDARLREVIAQLRREEDEVHLVVPPTHTHTHTHTRMYLTPTTALEKDKLASALVRCGAAIRGPRH